MKRSELKKAESEGASAQKKGLYPVHCPYPRTKMELRDSWLRGWAKSVEAEAAEFVRSKRVEAGRWSFKATLTKDDERSGFKKGKKFDPRGFYYNCNKQIILVGSVKGEHCGMLAFPVDSVRIEVEHA